jgi:hypothetical protein
MPTTGITPRSLVVYETSILVDPTEQGTYYFTRISVNANTTALVIGDADNSEPGIGEDILRSPVRGVGHKRRYGIQARHVTLTRITGASPTQGRIYRVIPILTNDIYTAIVAQLFGAPSISYEAQTDWTIAGVSAETYAGPGA